MTDTERRLWRCLRGHRFAKFAFRRQAPIGSFIVDFVCHARRLIIEVDGGQHDERNVYDSERDQWLRSAGYCVLRFWNHDVLRNLDGVLMLIADALVTPLPNPPPQGGRGCAAGAENSIPTPDAARRALLSGEG